MLTVVMQGPSGAWEWFFGWADVAGGIGAIVAIVFARAAQRDATRARREVGLERRRQFELEVLRELLREFDEQGLPLLPTPARFTQHLGRYRHRLGLLRPELLPFWREVAAGDWWEPFLARRGLTIEEVRDGTQVIQMMRDDLKRQVVAGLVTDLEKAISERIGPAVEASRRSRLLFWRR